MVAEKPKGPAGQDPHAQPKPENVGRTGYGELKGELNSFYGGNVKRIEDFPKDFTPLQRKNWYNFQLNQKLPSFVSSSAEENRRLWQDIEVERMLDHQPTHELHSSELPNYHFWPRAQNEVLAPFMNNTKDAQGKIAFNVNDQSDIPRFHRTGIPKTPRQEQDWYVPLQSDGSYNWRQNIRQNGYSASFADIKGWNMRFYFPTHHVLPWLGVSFMPQFIAANVPMYFRHNELPWRTRTRRLFYGSHFDRHMIFAGIYLGLLLWGSGGDARWRRLNWENEPWNYDIAFMQNYRNKGGFHGII